MVHALNKIFDQNFDFASNLRCSSKILIFDENFDFYANIIILFFLPCTKRPLWWDNNYGERVYQYFPFSNISDIIDQFNYVGFHDVCNYPGTQDLTPYKQSLLYNLTASKGIGAVIGGYSERNSTGKTDTNIFYRVKNITSLNDFGQSLLYFGWLT